jgi:hypothetical protein
MEVNFNNLRRRACIAYDKLTAKLNERIVDGLVIEMNTSHIQKEMEDLRMTIAWIAMCYEEGDPNMIDVWTDLYGEDDSMESFNANTEEE